MYVVITANLVVNGPFDSEESAIEWAKTRKTILRWWVGRVSPIV